VTIQHIKAFSKMIEGHTATFAKMKTEQSQVFHLFEFVVQEKSEAKLRLIEIHPIKDAQLTRLN
jgi:hypothetical protein